MRWWKWAAGCVGVAALGAFAALWALTAARADLDRQDDRLEGLGRRLIGMLAAADPAAGPRATPRLAASAP